MLPIVYTQPNCGPCQVLKKWLQSNNIIYTEKGAKEAVEAGYRSTPVLEYRGQVLHGFDINKLKEMFPHD